jgi:hypothetical protein
LCSPSGPRGTPSSGRFSIGMTRPMRPVAGFTQCPPAASTARLMRALASLSAMALSASCVRPVRLAYQPPANSTFLSQQISHQQPASSTFLSEQISTSHQPPAKRTASTGLWTRGTKIESRTRKDIPPLLLSMDSPARPSGALAIRTTL